MSPLKNNFSKIKFLWESSVTPYMFLYSVGVIVGYAFAKFLTPRMPRLKTKRFHFHHWIWASCLLVGAYYFDAPDAIYGILTGVALQGLSYAKWNILRAEVK